MFCVYCGTEHADDAEFCGNCGKRIMKVQNVPVEAETEEKVELVEAAEEEVAATEVQDTMVEAEAEIDAALAAEEPEVEEKSESETVVENVTMEEMKPETVEPAETVEVAETPIVTEHIEQPAVSENEVSPKVKKVKKERKRPIFVSIICTFLSILWMVPMLVLTLCLLFRITYNNVTENITVSTFTQDTKLKDFPVGEVMSSFGIEGLDVEEDAVLSEVIYEYLEEAGTYDNVKESDIEDMLDKIAADEFLNDVMQDYMKVMSGESNAARIKPEQIVEFVENNERVIEQTLDIKIVQEDYEALEAYLEDELDIKEATRFEKPEEATPVTTATGIVFGDAALVFVIVGLGFVICAIFIILLNSHKRYVVLCFSGICFVLSGIAGLILSSIAGSVVTSALGMNKKTVNMLLGGIKSNSIKNSLIFLGIGVVILLFYFVIDLIATKITVKKKQKTA